MIKRLVLSSIVLVSCTPTQFSGGGQQQVAASASPTADDSVALTPEAPPTLPVEEPSPSSTSTMEPAPSPIPTFDASTATPDTGTPKPAVTAQPSPPVNATPIPTAVGCTLQTFSSLDQTPVVQPESAAQWLAASNIIKSRLIKGTEAEQDAVYVAGRNPWTGNATFTAHQQVATTPDAIARLVVWFAMNKDKFVVFDVARSVFVVRSTGGKTKDIATRSEFTSKMPSEINSGQPQWSTMIHNTISSRIAALDARWCE